MRWSGARGKRIFTSRGVAGSAQGINGFGGFGIVLAMRDGRKETVCWSSFQQASKVSFGMFDSFGTYGTLMTVVKTVFCVCDCTALRFPVEITGLVFKRRFRCSLDVSEKVWS